jgi:hypothetical protein
MRTVDRKSQRPHYWSEDWEGGPYFDLGCCRRLTVPKKTVELPKKGRKPSRLCGVWPAAPTMPQGPLKVGHSSGVTDERRKKKIFVDRLDFRPSRTLTPYMTGS